jgi:hypothetical protein
MIELPKSEYVEIIPIDLREDCFFRKLVGKLTLEKYG